MTGRITRAKLRRPDYYRAQVNCDKRAIAFEYNPLADRLSRDQLRVIRNEMADAIEHVIRLHFQVQFRDPREREWLKQWVDDHVDPALRYEVHTRHRRAII